MKMSRAVAAVTPAALAGGGSGGHVRALVGQRLSELEARLADLTRLREEMRSPLREWDARLARTPEGQRARLLDVLAEYIR